MKVKNDHRRKFSKQLERRSLKKSGLQRDSTRSRDLRDTSAMLYQLSYEATHWGISIVETIKKLFNKIKIIKLLSKLKGAERKKKITKT